MIFHYSRDFEKQYRQLSKQFQKKVRVRMELLLVDEHHPLLKNHSLHGPYEGCRSINITADYRVIYSRMSGGVFEVIAVGTHSKLYE